MLKLQSLSCSAEIAKSFLQRSSGKTHSLGVSFGVPQRKVRGHPRVLQVFKAAHPSSAHLVGSVVASAVWERRSHSTNSNWHDVVRCPWVQSSDAGLKVLSARVMPITGVQFRQVLKKGQRKGGIRICLSNYARQPLASTLSALAVAATSHCHPVHHANVVTLCLHPPCLNLPDQ